jgi:hypothetical protein
MADLSVEAGFQAFDSETPEWQKFFEGLATRLIDKEVFFVADIRNVADQACLALNMSSANTALRSWKRQSIMLHLGVAVDTGSLYHHPLCFDRQYPAADLRLHEAIERNMGETPPYTSAFQENIDRFLQYAEERHLAYVTEAREFSL